MRKETITLLCGCAFVCVCAALEGCSPSPKPAVSDMPGETPTSSNVLGTVAPEMLETQVSSRSTRWAIDNPSATPSPIPTVPPTETHVPTATLSPTITPTSSKTPDYQATGTVHAEKVQTRISGAAEANSNIPNEQERNGVSEKLFKSAVIIDIGVNPEELNRSGSGNIVGVDEELGLVYILTSHHALFETSPENDFDIVSLSIRQPQTIDLKQNYVIDNRSYIYAGDPNSDLAMIAIRDEYLFGRFRRNGGLNFEDILTDITEKELSELNGNWVSVSFPGAAIANDRLYIVNTSIEDANWSMESCIQHGNLPRPCILTKGELYKGSSGSLVGIQDNDDIFIIGSHSGIVADRDVAQVIDGASLAVMKDQLTTFFDN